MTIRGIKINETTNYRKMFKSSFLSNIQHFYTLLNSRVITIKYNNDGNIEYKTITAQNLNDKDAAIVKESNSLPFNIKKGFGFGDFMAFDVNSNSLVKLNFKNVIDITDF